MTASALEWTRMYTPQTVWALVCVSVRPHTGSCAKSVLVQQENGRSARDEEQRMGGGKED